MHAGIRLRRFWSLPRRDRTLFLQALGLVAGIRAGFGILGFRTTSRLLGRWFRGPRDARADAEETERVIWAVERASRRVPGSRCLDRALAARLLLGRRGVATELRLGTQKDERGRLRAHAWLEKDGVVVIGGEPGGLSSYSALPALREEFL